MEKSKKIRIFDYPWHIPHQYEMGKFPFADFSWLCQPRRQYSQIPRGDLEAKNMFKWVPYYEEDKYDVAIFHLDQACAEEQSAESGKGSVYTHLNRVVKDIPKIVIMHGTPYYPEKFPDPREMINKIKKMVGDNYFVVNSHQAAKQWGLPDTKIIIHGMDKNEWWDLPKKPRVVSVIGRAGFDAYYDRPFLEAVLKELTKRQIKNYHVPVDYAPKNFNEYRRFLGQSLIYFNPTKESPMPRARTEAMLSGGCVLTTPYQDADTFIKNGVNGFLINRDPTAVADLCERLIRDPQLAVAIGQSGQKTAQSLFGLKRYQEDWRQYLNFVIADYRQKKLTGHNKPGHDKTDRNKLGDDKTSDNKSI